MRESVELVVRHGIIVKEFNQVALLKLVQQISRSLQLLGLGVDEVLVDTIKLLHAEIIANDGGCLK